MNGKLEVSVGKARVLTAKTGQGLENDRARFEAHDTQGTPVEVSLNVSGAQEGFVYRGFWFGEPTGRTFDDSPLGGEDDGR
ncbi:MAG: hypothetical protein EOO71_01775 [Myxococcaceae bacterium]|nr:MAG: hypothetical protein EOO71_01775 [Myxococcaceae bacterium]